jgi:hypothetical protein
MCPNTSFHFRLDPSVDEIAHYSEVRPQRHKLSYAIKQLVSHEIELQRMREEGAVKTAFDGTRAGGESPRPKFKAEGAAAAKVLLAKTAVGEEKQQQKEQQTTAVTETDVSSSPSSTPRHLQKLEAKNINGKIREVEARRPVDFFGRPIVRAAGIGSASASGSGLQHQAADKNELVSSDIWFKFKEGYNNAVRRLVRMRDLQ